MGQFLISILFSDVINPTKLGILSLFQR